MSFLATVRLNVFLDAVRLELHDKRLAAALSGRLAFSPWSTSAWPRARDGINARWRDPLEPSPAAKFATAFGLDVQAFADQMSLLSGVDASRAIADACSSDPTDLPACPSGFVCGVRRNATLGRCVAPSEGLQDAWGRAAVEVALPSCAVSLHGVTFHPQDLQALVLQFYWLSTQRRPRATMDARNIMRFGREFPACDVTALHLFLTTDEGACRDVSPAVFHELLINALGLARAPLLLRWSTQSVFVPVLAYRIRSHRVLSTADAVRAFGRAFQGNYTLMAQMPSRASVVTMEIDWMNLLGTSEDAAAAAAAAAALSVVRTTLTYVVEVWMDKETTAGAWLSEPTAPVPVSLELVSPLTLEEDAAIGLTAERLQQLLHAPPSPSARCKSSEELLRCNRLPMDLVLARESTHVRHCERVTGHAFDALTPIQDATFPTFCRVSECVHVVEQLRRIEYRDCVFANGFRLVAELSRVVDTCIDFSFTPTNSTDPPEHTRTRAPVPVTEPPTHTDINSNAPVTPPAPSRTKAPRPRPTHKKSNAPVASSEGSGSADDWATEAPAQTSPENQNSLAAPPRSDAPSQRSTRSPSPSSESQWPSSTETNPSMVSTSTLLPPTSRSPVLSSQSHSTDSPSVVSSHVRSVPPPSSASAPATIHSLRLISDQDAWYLVASGVIALSILLLELVVLVSRCKTPRKKSRRTRRHRRLDAAFTATNTATISVSTLLPGVSLWEEARLLDRYVSPTRIHDVRVLGGGAFGVVFLVRITPHLHPDRQQLVAAKRLALSQRQDVAAQQQLINEIKVAATLEHPNIVALVGASWTTRADVQALFEFMSLGDLRSYLETTTATSPTWDRRKLRLALDVAFALAYLHGHRPTALVHRDLKSSNVLLGVDRSRVCAKLCDFGVCRAATSVTSSSDSQSATGTIPVGTSRWLAPEIILGGAGVHTASDIYAFGVVLSELDTHRVPFSEMTGADGAPLPTVAVLQKVATDGLQPSLSASCPEAVAALARRCMAYDAAERPSASAMCATLQRICREMEGVVGESLGQRSPQEIKP
ncbi:hypothetical protein PINS_up007049 [Pythium insidiosum]|nr:hypothetical protein PINS_up007049 [Pythium insidiosum]